MVKTEDLLGNILITDPFELKNVSGLHIHWMVYTKRWSAHIEFKNGDTSGKQEFSEEGPDGLPKLLDKVRKFLDFIG